MSNARIIMRELQDLMTAPLDDIKIQMPDDLTTIEVEMKGPADTPFANGIFTYTLTLPADYPTSAPKGNFRTRIFHPNVAPGNGDICVNTLKRDWEPNLGLRHVLSIIRCLLIEPNPESALNEEAGKLLLENFEEYSSRARMMTNVHAMPQGGSKAASGLGAVPVSQESANTMNNNSGGGAGNGGENAVVGIDGAAAGEKQQAPKSKAAAADNKRRQMLKRL